MLSTTSHNPMQQNTYLKRTASDQSSCFKATTLSNHSLDEYDDCTPEVYLENGWTQDQRSFTPMIQMNQLGYQIDEALKQQYCLWELNLLSTLVGLQCEDYISKFPNLIPSNNAFMNFGILPDVNDANNALNIANRVLGNKPQFWKTTTDVQRIQPNSVYECSDMGEKAEDAEKESYIKAIFHIERVNRNTQKKVRLNKHRHVISHCEHVGAQYYARGMCKKCYFSKGKRKKKASKCPHPDRSHYAIGMCKLWYLKNYHKTHDRKKVEC